MKKSVWHFYKKAHAHPVELMGIMDYDKQSYTSVGTEDSVPPKWEGILKGITEGIYYDGHNHPGDSTCFQSYADFENILIMNTKYAYTIGKDGFMIVKNTHNEYLSKDDLDHNYDDYDATRELVKLKKQMLSESKELQSYNTVHHEIYETFHKKYQKELEKIAEDSIIHNNEFNVDDIDYGKFDRESSKLFQSFVSDNIKDYVNDLNNEFNNNNVNTMQVYYTGKYDKKGE